MVRKCLVIFSFSYLFLFMAAVRTRAAMVFESNFETGAIQCKTCNPDGWRAVTYDPAAMTIVTSPVREGTKAIKFRLDNNYNFGSENPRSELQSSPNMTFFDVKKEYWVGWSIYLPPEYAFDRQQEILTQFRHRNVSCDTIGGVPPNSLVGEDGHWYWHTRSSMVDCLTVNIPPTMTTDLGTMSRGRWTDFVARVKFSWEGDGILQVWKDGVLKVNQVNKANYYNRTVGSFMGVGIYKSNWLKFPAQSDVTTRTTYADAIKVFEGSNGYAMVAPGGGTPSPGLPTPTPTLIIAGPTMTPIPGYQLLTSSSAGVTASSNDGNLPSNTVDNNLNTRWSASGDGQWIQYDLGKVYTVGYITIAVFEGTTRKNIFEIQVSSDGSNWQTVWSGQSSGKTLQPEVYDFPDVQGRYVRYLGHLNTVNEWNSVTEVAIYGKDSSISGQSINWKQLLMQWLTASNAAAQGDTNNDGKVNSLDFK